MTVGAEDLKAIGSVLSGIAVKVSAGVGLASAVGAFWVTSGLPMPATQTFVADKVAMVEKRIDALASSTLELQRESILARKGRLRFELTASEAAIQRAADAAQRATLKRRAEEVRDELSDLDKSDDALRARIDRFKS